MNLFHECFTSQSVVNMLAVIKSVNLYPLLLVVVKYYYTIYLYSKSALYSKLDSSSWPYHIALLQLLFIPESKQDLLRKLTVKYLKGNSEICFTCCSRVIVGDTTLVLINNVVPSQSGSRAGTSVLIYFRGYITVLLWYFCKPFFPCCKLC